MSFFHVLVQSFSARRLFTSWPPEETALSSPLLLWTLNTPARQTKPRTSEQEAQPASNRG